MSKPGGGGWSLSSWICGVRVVEGGEDGVVEVVGFSLGIAMLGEARTVLTWFKGKGGKDCELSASGSLILWSAGMEKKEKKEQGRVLAVTYNTEHGQGGVAPG